MYAGSIVEAAEKHELFKNPKHPYTLGLFESIPDIASDVEALKPIKGLMPDPMHLPSGCPFHPRCDQVRPECSNVVPKSINIGNDHFVKCILFNK